VKQPTAQKFFIMDDFMLDVQKVNEAVENDGSKGSDTQWLTRQDIPSGGDIDIRLMPPKRSMNGNFYFKRQVIWVNRKPHTSPRTFGLPCPIMDRADEIRKHGTDAQRRLLKKRNQYQESTEYITPVLHLEDLGNGDFKVKDDQVKFFNAPWTVIKKIKDFITHKHYQNGTPLGLMDPKKGWNLTISKTGSGKDTEYGVIVFPMQSEMQEKYYHDCPDLVDAVRAGMYQEEYLQQVADHYFDGAPEPNEDLKYPDRDDEDDYEDQPEQPKKAAENPVKGIKKASKAQERNTEKQGNSILDRIKQKNS